MQVHVHLWSISFIGHVKGKEVYFLCCDKKARAASAQSFTLWQQVTIEITWWDHSIIAYWHHMCMGIALNARTVWVNRTFSTIPIEGLQKHRLLFATNCTDHTFFLSRLHLARLAYPGHSTTLLRLESPSSKCAKIHTVAASNNRDHTPSSPYYCLFVPHIYGCCPSCTSRSWWIAHSTQRQPRDCNTCSKVGLDLLKWLRVKEPSKMQTAFTKTLGINNLQSNLLQQHWAPF